jgi:uncharacterized protein
MMNTDLNKSFISAVEKKDLTAAREFVALGADVNSRNVTGTPALFLVMSSPEMTRLLLELGADPNMRDDFGEPALINAAVVNQTETVRTLLEFGADIHVKDKRGNTALIMAVDSGEQWANTVKVLMEGGASSTQPGTRGESALDLAKRSGFKRLITLLCPPSGPTQILGKNGVYCIFCKSRFSIDECIDPQVRDDKYILFTCPKCKVPRLHNAIEDLGL